MYCDYKMAEEQPKTDVKAPEAKVPEQKAPAVEAKPTAPVVQEQKVPVKAPEAKPVEKAPVKAPAPKVESKAPVKVLDNFKHIVRIAQVDIPGDKPLNISLRKIKGVGFNLAAVACNLAGIKQGAKTGELTDVQIKKLNEVLMNPVTAGIPVWMFNRRKDYETGEDQHLLIGTLDFAKDNSIKLLRKIKCYRGIRHSARRPVRGQRTKANFRKSKGKVVGVAKKKAAKAGK